MVSKIQLPIGGLWANCYGVNELLASKETKKTALCLFFLHGRFGSAERIEHVVEKTYHDVVAHGTQSENQGDKPRKHLIIVTFDQRNHGTRKISAKGQQAWNEGNLKHAQDMLAMLVGTANDVSFLADYLPSFLFPDNGIEITDWAVTGISLGGHSVWHVLKNDPRFKIGVPMLGCPSYRVLMRHRAGVNNLPYEPPYMPTSLQTLLDRIDPDGVPYTSADPAQNPFMGKKILVLAGEVDELVPWECGRKFVEGLVVGSEAEKKVCIEPGRGHETSNYMIGELVEWVIKYGL